MKKYKRPVCGKKEKECSELRVWNSELSGPFVANNNTTTTVKLKCRKVIIVDIIILYKGRSADASKIHSENQELRGRLNVMQQEVVNLKKQVFNKN